MKARSHVFSSRTLYVSLTGSTSDQSHISPPPPPPSNNVIGKSTNVQLLKLSLYFFYFSAMDDIESWLDITEKDVVRMAIVMYFYSD